MSNIVKTENQQITHAERFTNKIISEFGTNVGELALTNFQKRLVQNYFISIDGALRAAEEKRKKKTKDQEQLPITWENVNMESLSRGVVAAARVGLDPAQPNHVNMMPFKNNALNKYDIVFIDGYRGIELKSKKYGLDIPDCVIVELVHANDTFKPIKKDAKNRVESYEFDISNPFDRGNIIGGFYYHVYSNNPEKNKLVMMSIQDIEKRKPKYASVEFWGGEKDIWENGKKVGKEKTDGWFEKMCLKTIYRAAYRDITIDSQKIDNDYHVLKKMEESFSESEIEQEIETNANIGDVIDITDDVPFVEVVDETSMDKPEF